MSDLNEEPDGTTFNKIDQPADPVMSDIDQTLEDRGNRYGSFVKNAYIAQSLKRAVRENRKWETLPDYQKEAIDMIFYKIARVIEGDTSYPDNWHDIAGYAVLVENILRDRVVRGKV